MLAGSDLGPVIDLFSSDYVMNYVLAQTPGFLEVLSSSVVSATNGLLPNVTALQTGACALLMSEKQFFPEMRPDQLSFPVDSAVWRERRVHTNASMWNVTCDYVGAADCSGAPCFADPHAAGPLNLTCLCPVFETKNVNKTFYLGAADVGRFGGCDAYNDAHGPCAVQEGMSGWPHDYMGDGDQELRFVVAAVESMRTASRERNALECNNWWAFADGGVANRRASKSWRCTWVVQGIAKCANEVH